MLAGRNVVFRTRPCLTATGCMGPAAVACFARAWPDAVWKIPLAVFDKLVPMYQNNSMSKTVQRVQTGVRIEKRLLKVLKALAEQLDMSLGDLLEGMALHCFEGKLPFSDETLSRIGKLKEVYELDLNAGDSHKLDERGSGD